MITYLKSNICIWTAGFHREVEKQASSNYFLEREILSRITALSLPIIYAINSIIFFVVGLGIKLTNPKAFFKNEHYLGGYFWKIASFSLQQIYKSIDHIVHPSKKSLIVPENLVHALPKKAVVCRNGLNTRVGSNINSYVKGRWIVYQLQKKNPDIEFIYRPFNLGSYLQLSRMHQHSMPEPYSFQGSSLVKGFKTLGSNPNIHDFTSMQDLEEFFDNNNGIVEIVPFKDTRHIEIDWNDKGFFNLIKNELRFVPEIDANIRSRLSLPPDDCSFSIALHVRTGGDFDPDNVKFNLPTKIPPRSYYEYAIDKALEKYSDEQVYIQIFTDSTSPQKVKEHYKEYISANHPKIRFQIEVDDSSEQKETPLLDMFSMLEYDVLIRSSSLLSSLLGVLTDYQYEIFPSNRKKTENTSEVSQVRIIEKRDNTIIKRHENVRFSYSF